jgi:hypothetical protein
MVNGEIASVTRTIDAFASDPDRGIQQLRQALERERAALNALGQSIAQRAKVTDALSLDVSKIERSRTKALEESREMLEGMKGASEAAGVEAAAWAEYYRKLAEGSEGTAVPITAAPPGVQSVTLNDPIPAPVTVTPVLLIRYTGSWEYPQTNGLFHGAQPETIDVEVNEEKGHVTGTFTGKFKLPPGSKGDPVLKFEFSGDLQPTRNQVFNLVSAEGAKGTVELIPGTAFNLLEVNFQTEQKPGKVRQADAVLVKK